MTKMSQKKKLALTTRVSGRNASATTAQSEAVDRKINSLRVSDATKNMKRKEGAIGVPPAQYGNSGSLTPKQKYLNYRWGARKAIHTRTPLTMNNTSKKK